MKVFVTGASGWIGSAVTAELLAEGHEVVGLARSDESAAAIFAAGATPHRGTLDDASSIRTAAETADGVVHLAFNHDFANFAESGRTERRIVETLGDTLAGSDRPLLVASGVAMGAGTFLTEDFRVPDAGADSPRGASEAVALSYAERGVRSGAVRFAPTVHGPGDHGFVSTLVSIARAKGVSGYVDDGSNRWPAVHRRDAATLVRLALESASPGTVVHAVAEEGVATRNIAEAIGRHLDLPVTSIEPADAAAHFDWLGRFFSMDVPASSALTRERFGWTPTHPTLLEDLDSGSYFA